MGRISCGDRQNLHPKKGDGALAFLRSGVGRKPETSEKRQNIGRRRVAGQTDLHRQIGLPATYSAA